MKCKCKSACFKWVSIGPYKAVESNRPFKNILKCLNLRNLSVLIYVIEQNKQLESWVLIQINFPIKLREQPRTSLRFNSCWILCFWNFSTSKYLHITYLYTFLQIWTEINANEANLYDNILYSLFYINIIFKCKLEAFWADFIKVYQRYIN